MTDFIPFSVDTGRVLELLAKQIYQSPFALLRENTQNAFDAILLRRHLDNAYEPRIEIEINAEQIVVRDNGIGMTPGDLNEHFWRAGSSSKNTDEARAAGVVGTFGIGAMANFGIATSLEVITESALSGERTRCTAVKNELKFNQDCIAREYLASTGFPGTQITATLEPGILVDPLAVTNYVAEFVSLLKLPVTVNGVRVSGKSIEDIVPPMSTSWSDVGTDVSLSDRLVADYSIRISNNADVQLQLNNIRWYGLSLPGQLLLRSGVATMRTFRSGFGLATTAVGSAYQFGGVADLSGFQPTAGREALTTDSMQLLQNIVSDIDGFTSLQLAGRQEADASTPFMQWIVSTGRYDLCDNLKVSIQPGDRTALATIREWSSNRRMPVYEGVDQTVIASFSSDDAPLIMIARNAPRRQCELHYLAHYCNTEHVSDTPLVEARLRTSDLTTAQLALSFRVQSILETDYFLTCAVVFGSISHGLALLVTTENDVTVITIDPASPTVVTVLSLYESEYSAFGSMVKDYVRNAIFPKVSDRVPSSTKQGAEAFLRQIRRPKELFEYEDSETSSLASIWNDYGDGLISLDEAISRSQFVAKQSVQVVETSNSARVSDIIPDVIVNEQTTQQSSVDIEQSLDALPPIIRTDTLSSAKLLTIPHDQPALDGYRCFIAVTEKVRADLGDFFLQPHKTAVVWGGQKVLFIFLHHSGDIGLYYDLQTRESVSTHSGGRAFKTCTIVLKNSIYIPVPPELEDRFIPSPSERKRFEVRCDLLKVERQGA